MVQAARARRDTFDERDHGHTAAAAIACRTCVSRTTVGSARTGIDPFARATGSPGDVSRRRGRRPGDRRRCPPPWRRRGGAVPDGRKGSIAAAGPPTRPGRARPTRREHRCAQTQLTDCRGRHRAVRPGASSIATAPIRPTSSTPRSRGKDAGPAGDTRQGMRGASTPTGTSRPAGPEAATGTRHVSAPR
jgi:hypothetical protein